MADKTDIWVYAHWKDMNEPKCIGILAKRKSIMDEVISSVSSWQLVAREIGIPRSEQILMNGAFRV